eukprot:CAMPEP_0206460096 /NCGR_PEP_ID=MMETSP0324_2-20121206/24565_1 /ASSEMBLY_ACC=CAM_ASM_000836 /TAXON_ID=2866 /ORGANISM="Crypthecodinium cohnii, Strain Seligo" /LENGTH=340 /DNA_ID=CAMNT_0053931767 /DNA_START=164 /DNA_END=1186 /DNA_ORIENTATION=-
METPLSSSVKQVAIVGTGVIGSGWAALFLAKGYDVVAYVRSERSEKTFREGLALAHNNLIARGLAKESDDLTKIRSVYNLAECVGKADFVQESVIEDLTTKQAVVREIDEFAPEHAIIASSSSFLPLLLVAARARRHPNRIMTAHPTLPQWDAFCEVYAPTPELTARLAELYEGGLGMDVVEMKRQHWGHVLNALYLSLSSMSQVLVQTGVADSPSIEVAMRHLGRLLIAADKFGEGSVAILGGGSKEATLQLMTHIVTGAPMAISTCMVARVLPGFLARPYVRFLQFLWSPVGLFRGLVYKVSAWASKPMFASLDTSPEHMKEFQAGVLRRMCAVEKIA